MTDCSNRLAGNCGRSSGSWPVPVPKHGAVAVAVSSSESGTSAPERGPLRTRATPSSWNTPRCSGSIGVHPKRRPQASWVAPFGEVEVTEVEAGLLHREPLAVEVQEEPQPAPTLVRQQAEAEQARRSTARRQPREQERLVPAPHVGIVRVDEVVVGTELDCSIRAHRQAPSMAASQASMSVFCCSVKFAAASGPPHCTIARVAVTTMMVAPNAVQ